MFGDIGGLQTQMIALTKGWVGVDDRFPCTPGSIEVTGFQQVFPTGVSGARRQPGAGTTLE